MTFGTCASARPLGQTSDHWARDTRVRSITDHWVLSGARAKLLATGDADLELIEQRRRGPSQSSIESRQSCRRPPATTCVYESQQQTGCCRSGSRTERQPPPEPALRPPTSRMTAASPNLPDVCDQPSDRSRSPAGGSFHRSPAEAPAANQAPPPRVRVDTGRPEL